MAVVGARRGLLVVVSVLLFTGLALATATEGEADRRDVALDYAIYLGGVEVVEADISLALDDGGYDLEAELKTRGFIGQMFPWSMRAKAKGRVKAPRLHPQEAHSENMWRGKKGWVSLRFGEDGPKVVSAEPERDPIAAAPEIMRGAIDVGSALLSMTRATGDGWTCDPKVPVFDGRRRFDFLLDPVGKQEMSRGRYSAFAGTAVRCKLSLVVLLGEKEEGDYGGLGSSGREITVWLGSLFDGVPPVPVRVEYETDWGYAVAHLASASYREAGREKTLSRRP